MIGVFLAGLAMSLAFWGSAPTATGFVSLRAWSARDPLMRVQLRLAADSHKHEHLLLLTLGGPVYCGQLYELVRRLHASLVCPDYGRNAEKSGSSRAARIEDWGDPTYLDAVARLPDQLVDTGVKVSALLLVGPSYAGYADAQLVATHPRLRPRALIIVDSFLDLSARYRALAPADATQREMNTVLGGTVAQRPGVYAARSPSSHLAGLAAAIRSGMQFVSVWSTGRHERREFNRATCSRLANAEWIARLARLLNRPLVSHVTQLSHGDALRRFAPYLLALAGIGKASSPLPARTVVFRPGAALPAGSYCSAASRATRLGIEGHG